MPMRNGKDVQPQNLKMTVSSQIPQPNLTLENVAKNMQDMMAKNIQEMKVQMTAMQQQSQAQTNELKARFENIERSHHDDNEGQHERNRNHERNRWAGPNGWLR